MLSSNAMTDQGFSKGKSIHNMGIRSSFGAPIKRWLDRMTKVCTSPEEVVGVIYIDSSVKNYVCG